MNPPELLDPAEMPRFGNLNVPTHFYTVLERPARLAGMPYPRSQTPWRLFSQEGFKHVVNLTGEKPNYDPYPLNMLYAASLEDLVHGGSPFRPEQEEARLQAAVEKILPVLQRGEGVIVHCMGGTGRTGTLLGAVLVKLGLPAESVIDYLNQVNHHRAGRHWPESPWQADFLRQLEGE